MDPRTHARFLEYRERCTYFARAGERQMDAASFTAAFAQHAQLEKIPEGARSDEEEARLAELRAALYLD